MAVKRKEIESIPVLKVKGAFYGGNETNELDAAIQHEMTKGNYRIVLDLTDCSRVTSPMIGVLIKAHLACEARGGGLKLCGVGGQPLTILEMTNLLFKFDHHKDAVRAVAEFLGKSVRTE